jgi:hypothetical protein
MGALNQAHSFQVSIDRNILVLKILCGMGTRRDSRCRRSCNWSPVLGPAKVEKNTIFCAIFRARFPVRLCNFVRPTGR